MGLKKKIIGGLELLMLFGRGIEGFSGERRPALLSFIIPVALFPAQLVFSAFYAPKGMEGLPLARILATVTAQSAISTALGIALVVLLARQFGRFEKIWLYFEASNWTGLVLFVVTFPIIPAAILGWFPREEIDRISVLLQCYGYVVTGCIFFRALDIRWQLAGFMAVVTLFANQITWDMLFRLQNIAQPW